RLRYRHMCGDASRFYTIRMAARNARFRVSSS
ncbi:hypothetical protein GCK32_021459, partial [Trichostrongylus colubriformis]